VLELRAPMMVKGRYDQPTMKVSVWRKDMDVLESFAQGARADAAVFGDIAGLRGGLVERAWRRRHRLDLRGARSDGGP